MVDRLRRWIRLIAAAALLCCVLLPGAWAAEGEAGSATILFTHDLHSSFLPRKDGAGGTAGGYARLASALKEERSAHPGALTVDGGDFSVGSLIQTLYPTQAAELRTMGAMGYDAVTVGNHEFDYTGPGFGEMLTAARRSGEKTPALLLANYRPEEDSPDRLDLQRAMAAYGVEESMLLERGGVWLTGEKTTVLSEKHTETEIWKNDLEDDRLYRVVTGMYSAQMLDTVKDRSFGLLSIVPKDERGEPVTDFFQRILRDRNGNEIKEWYALAAYLRSFGEKGVPNAYALSGGDGRKQVSHSWSPGQLLGHLNWIGVSALVLLALAAAAAVLLARWALQARRRGRRGGGYRRRRLF